ncbi:hypothetical protein SADUNF_Sadunf12G0018200 [Salix dunnii]|uniref:Polymerase nucleotidyl transferase domain-containing protein n=1 Tax=Salix dunnii TaxID=1413687 RepID=A0A835JKL9_9ROSI|nr:hypothetical protein SADUNF_Sadunf12G0018200 [Salix dunnii]
MGGVEVSVQPSVFSPNGLLPNEATSVTQKLDPVRWSIAEERTAELISCIQPNQPSEERRTAVLGYVQRLIMKFLPCQVFAYGSVPLKTYLPDGDIDITVFTESQDLKKTWADEVKDILHHEESSENAEFHVKEVQYIQAEVKIIKCLVENIVVDISFNQLGGLCTLCFLEEVDQLISQNHLFKRSIILIKAWCYYESRILGAHHGLISTYALETLVLYIFHVFNNRFTGPLEVLYRFLEFFSKFDWENFCISLWGPVPISSLPDVTALSPREDGGQMLLSRLFLNACSSVYAVFPSQQENQEQSFVSKYFNVIDPLRTNNNLGRSVSNFYRIRSAFAFGAQRLARLLDCPKENLLAELNQFFMNTWDRHRKGHRPDVPNSNHIVHRPIKSNIIDDSETSRNYSSSKKTKEDPSGHQSKVGVIHAAYVSDGVTSQHGNHMLKRMTTPGDASAISGNIGQMMQANLTNFIASDHNNQNLRSISLNENVHNEKITSSITDYLGNEGHARYQFARTQSSPELMDTPSEVPSQGRCNKPSETPNGPTASMRPHNRRRNLVPEVLENHDARLSTENSISSRHSSSHQSIDAAVASTSASNSYFGDSGEGTTEDHLSLSETMQLHQEEQDRVNMASFSGCSVIEQGQMPTNLASGQLPFAIPPANLGYGQKYMTGTVPINAHSFESLWVPNMHYQPSFTAYPFPPHYPSMGMTLDQEVVTEKVDTKRTSTEFRQEVSDHGFWSKPVADYQQKNRSSQSRLQEHRQPLASVESSHVRSTRGSSSGSFSPRDHELITEGRDLIRENYSKGAEYQTHREPDDYSSASLRIVPVSQASSSGSKSEDNGDGLLLRTHKSMKGQLGKQSFPSTNPPIAYGMDKNEAQHEDESANQVSSQLDDDDGELIRLSTLGAELSESVVSSVGASSNVWTYQIPSYDPSSLSRSNSLLPVAPMSVGPESHQRTNNIRGALPLAFYPAGPPVPFLTMFPPYNLPTEAGTSIVSTRKFDRDEEINNSQNNHSSQILDSSESADQSENLYTCKSVNSASSLVHSEQSRSDILNSDFVSHWQNLQYGRLCQNAPNKDSLPLPYSVVPPPTYIQGHFPWDGPGRPANMNHFTQHMNGPHLIPVSPVQLRSSRQVGFYQHYADDPPRYRAGTGTYLPNPKLSFRDRQSSHTRNHGGNYNYDRKDHHEEREGGWNNNPRPRSGARGQSQNQGEKSSFRTDRSTANNRRSDRSWNSKQDPLPRSHPRNSFRFSNSTNRGSTNASYGMYPPVPVATTSGVSASVVMFYSFDQNVGYNSPDQHLEFVGPAHFTGDKASPYNHQDSSRDSNEQQDIQRDSDLSSPDQPSSP